MAHDDFILENIGNLYGHRYRLLDDLPNQMYLQPCAPLIQLKSVFKLCILSEAANNAC